MVGVISIAGRRGRAPSLTLSRAIFGVRGNIGPTLVSLMSRLGWETVNTTTAAFVLLSLCTILFQTPVEAKSAPLLTLLFIAIFVLLTLAVSGLGHATLLVIQKWATYVFGALNILVGGFLCATIDWSAVFNATPAPMSAMLIGIGTMAAGTGIGWANAGADMSRYQHRSVTAVRLVASAAFGAGIPLVLLITLGGLLSVGNNDLASATDPIIAIRDMLPTWMAVPYLITAFGGLLLSNNLSVYSAGLTTLTLGLKVKRVYAVIVDIVAIFAGSIYFMLIADSFYGPFITFISLLAVPITACAGFAQALDTLCDALARVVEAIRERSREDSEYPYRAAPDFLQLCGVALLALAWARAARVSRALPEDDPLRAAKLQSAGFFFDYLPSRLAQHLGAIDAARAALAFV
ncbi:purine-cytosine permease family protein [Pseudomonas emilianonis]|uniref:purine-cytosine permease family protein n=1 Tax=Pseudomonas emilianonis TaxID=2915812 RepID=UPI0031F4BE3B